MILREKIYRTIKARIINGEYQPGQVLNEKEIIEELQTSRTPFREAINALREEGLVQVYPHRGIFVRDLSLKDVADGFDIRFQLEPYVFSQACNRIPLGKVEELIGRIRKVDCSDYNSLLQEDDFFHMTVVKYIDNKQLTRIMENLYAYNRYQVTLFDDLKTNFVTGDRLKGANDSMEEHLEILRYMKERDEKKVMEMTRLHLERARKRTLR